MGLVFKEVPMEGSFSSAQKAIGLSCKNIKFLRALGFKVIKDGHVSSRQQGVVR